MVFCNVTPFSLYTGTNMSDDPTVSIFEVEEICNLQDRSVPPFQHTRITQFSPHKSNSHFGVQESFHLHGKIIIHSSKYNGTFSD
jgi:hypothetical protein